MFTHLVIAEPWTLQLLLHAWYIYTYTYMNKMWILRPLDKKPLKVYFHWRILHSCVICVDNVVVKGWLLVAWVYVCGETNSVQRTNKQTETWCQTRIKQNFAFCFVLFQPLISFLMPKGWGLFHSWCGFFYSMVRSYVFCVCSSILGVGFFHFLQILAVENFLQHFMWEYRYSLAWGFLL
jgi:hypothetical protein